MTFMPIGFRYGALSEDYFTGYRMKFEGWRSLFCYPETPAFLGDTPINFLDVLSQNKRWVIGQLEHLPDGLGTMDLIYMFLFLGAYMQDLFEFVVERGTIRRWWSDQRMWMMRGLSCYLFSLTEFLLTSIGIPAQGFNVTSKVTDDEQSKRYEQGLFEFRVPSPLFVTLAMAAIIILLSFILGLVRFINGSNKEGLEMQLLLTGFIVMNCLSVTRP
ncbi:Cellulose synthase-like protein G3 [Hibiscus syriacus]|uniref:Cellulose synthase-like protein G3 n=1 Tax=Hibiscus syriacus TaxID=106335 RepID=A0A6A2X4P3_HIBSY|nr:Cellulose synthase-like protein G3 [Hibiscus syriacus]